MEKKIEFTSKEDMQAKAKAQEAKGLHMTHSDFTNPNWKHGDPQVGVMTFTDEPEPVVVSKPTIEDRLAALEGTIKKAGL